MLASRPQSPFLIAILIASVSACDDSSPGAPDPEGIVGDPLAGATAFVEACAPCHASRDGFDLAFFSFPDTAIMRRASAHVDETTQRNLAAYIGTLDVDAVPRGSRPFQPGGTALVGDVAFAIGLFGSDVWPADMTTAELGRIDPTEVPVAVLLPQWSTERVNVDWMPDRPLPEGIIEFRGGLVRRSLDRYYLAPSFQTLGEAVATLRLADRSPDSPTAPCIREPEGLYRGEDCFEVRRWTASLVGQHMLRMGVDEPVHPVLHDTWWDVGNAARLSILSGGLENRDQNWASWMYLGWAFDPGRHASVYTGNGLVRLGLARHATFVALRSLVARPGISLAIFRDVRNAARFAPANWAFEATAFGYRHLLERAENGGAIRDAALIEAREDVLAAYEIAARKIGPEQRAQLSELRDAVLALL